MQWGLGAVVVIGGLVGAVLIPAAKRAEEARHERDLESDAGGDVQAGRGVRAGDEDAHRGRVGCVVAGRS